MKRFLAFAAAATVALTLVGCTTLQNVAGALTGGSVVSAAPATVADAEKGLTLAHLAYQGVSYGIQDAITTGYLHGTSAAQVKVWYDQAKVGLDAADAADAAANAQGVVDKVNAVNDLLTKIAPLLPATKKGT